MVTAIKQAKHPIPSLRESRGGRRSGAAKRIARTRLSTVQAKFAMAVSGAGLVGFVTIHMLGNLQIYLGAESLNAYAAKLKSMPGLLWTARIGLVAMFTIHIGLAFVLRKRNRQARRTSYAVSRPLGSSWASRTMLLSGLVILTFLVYHLLHFTLGVTDPASHHLVDAQGRHDVYSMVVLGFKQPLVAVSYVVAMLFLGLHLSHAISSIFQTLGLNSPRLRQKLVLIGNIVAWTIALGNMSIPVSILLGFVDVSSAGSNP